MLWGRNLAVWQPRDAAFKPFRCQAVPGDDGHFLAARWRQKRRVRAPRRLGDAQPKQKRICGLGVAAEGFEGRHRQQADRKAFNVARGRAAMDDFDVETRITARLFEFRQNGFLPLIPPGRSIYPLRWRQARHCLSRHGPQRQLAPGFPLHRWCKWRLSRTKDCRAPAVSRVTTLEVTPGYRQKAKPRGGDFLRLWLVSPSQTSAAEAFALARPGGGKKPCCPASPRRPA
jgi:hypothetical protein